MTCHRSPMLVLRTWMAAVLIVATVAVSMRSVSAAADDGQAKKQDAKKEELLKKDRKLIEGTWRIVSIETDGRNVAEEDLAKFRVVNGANGSWSIRDGERQIAQGTSNFDPTQSPKEIDFTVIQDGQEASHLGIYELGEKRRKLCFAPSGARRPTQFAAPAGSKLTFVTFERVK